MAASSWCCTLPAASVQTYSLRRSLADCGAPSASCAGSSSALFLRSFSNKRSEYFGGQVLKKSVSAGVSSAAKQACRKPVRLVAQAVTDRTSSEVAEKKGVFGGFFDWLKNLGTGGAPASETASTQDDMFTPKASILVVGATGKLGRLLVKELLDRSYEVIALVASEERAEEVFVKEGGMTMGRSGNGLLTAKVGTLDDVESLKETLKGVDAVVSAAGSRRGGSEEELTRGLAQLMRTFADLSEGREAQLREQAIFDFRGAPAGDNGAPQNGAALEDWTRLDDVIMGGISDSSFKQEGGRAIFQGTVRVEGGGFASHRAALPKTDLSGFDGISLRVKGDGKRYKLNMKSTVEAPEFTYQASFDTVRGQWVDVSIPFDRFRPVVRARVVEDGPKLDTSDIKTISVVLSRFEYDGFPNYVFTPGPFRLEIEHISAYKKPRPQFVLVSSAAVERSNRARTPEQRDRSIPIVKLNPGDILTWKLVSEDILKASGLAYAIVRPCGLTEEDQDTPFELEVAQGDAITGKVSRAEAARVVAATLDSADTVYTTFEVRRDALTKGFDTTDWVGLFRRLRPDVLPGIVAFTPPPKPTEDKEDPDAKKAAEVAKALKQQVEGAKAAVS
ncbi:hypothetical protein KFL_000530070 [Klebsormidium nitens]|uniref:NADH:ubiquinone oxidoreductase intermediate-associated protein 30 domain-containing protein n=1 Tax=Klebsormidium nitens TaxID=105231 RepID=A0A1Y1HT58_KLENI|nr:hypothetical protein KFL_000530070 [Klebsormidium nitens]|eukprot:GAQ80379.1 hypothetical protein KFL_000530070 [Klebsormidium nitens]